MNIPQLNQLHEILDDIVEKFPDKVAIRYQNQKITYKDLLNNINATAHYFIKQGCEPGDRIIICLGNSIDAAVGFWAALRANCVVSLINPNLPESKKAYIKQDSGAKLYVDYPLYQSEIHHKADESTPAKKRLRQDLASIIYTSGSTGEPKGVMLTHSNMLAATNSLNTYLQYRADDIVLCVSPLSFDYGLYQLIMSCSVGATLFLVPDTMIPGLLLKTIHKESITIVPGVPTLFSLLHQNYQLFKYDLSNVRAVTNTGAALGRNHIQMMKDIFPQAKLFSMYGLTECKRCTYLPPEKIDNKPDSVGIAIPNTHIWIADENDQPLPAYQIGQLVIEGETVMQGYWNKPEETAKKIKNGKLFTGDYGHLDEEGYFYFKGRMDEVIKYKGQKVSPREIEIVLGHLNEIAECAVIGKSYEDGLELHAYLTSATEKNISAEKILEHCKKHLAAYQLPTHIHFVHTLPKTDNGKINKKLLKSAKSLNELFSTTVQLYPNKTAIWADDKEYSYKTLSNDALQLAGLIANIKESSTCALFSTRSYTLYQSLLASLFAGKAYVPINPRIPVTRNAVMLAESLAKIVIIDKAAHDQAKALLAEVKIPLHVIFPDIEKAPDWAQLTPHHIYTKKDLSSHKLSAPQEVTGHDPAYLLFTSGSTGKPKGVAVSHENMLSYYEAGLQVYKPSEQDRFAQLTELTFDLSMHDIFLAWGTGASLYCLPEKLYGNLNFYLGVAKFVKEHQLTYWMSVPSTATVMYQTKVLKQNDLSSLKCTVFCGEPLANNLASYWHHVAPNSKIFNLYGPTEATIGFTLHEWKPSDLSEIVSIGKPLPSQQVCVIDAENNICQPGSVGELCLGGSQVVAGYWQNPEMSAQKFITLNVNDSPIKTWYRTGDLVIQNPDQTLKFIGRVDDQLQIRGCRVERLEIELELKKIAQTESVAVVPWPIATDGTVLGVTAFMSATPISESEILKKCKSELPSYMIPNKIHFVDQLPFNSNGKVDYKFLKQNLAQPQEIREVAAC